MACRYTYQGKTYEAHEFDDVLKAMPPSIASKYIPGIKATPDGPFIGKDPKPMLALAVKRMIAYAAQNGYDKVAFVNGEQSAERYDLSKQVGQIEYYKNKDGKYQISATAIGDNRTSLLNNAYAENELEDVVGKGVAEKIINGQGSDAYISRPGHPDGNKLETKILRGLDLKVGGEGMKSFYDRIVPQVINDVLKKVGGDRVESIRFNDFESKNGASDDKLLSDLGVDVSGTRPAGQPGFTITPEMREKVAGGQALFSRRRDRTNIDTALRRMGKFVDAFEAGQVKAEDTQLLGPTPVVLRAIGAQEFDLEIDGAVLQKTLDGKHSYAVTPDIMKKLPEGLYDPVMAFSQPDGGVLLVTETESEFGNPIVSAVHFRVRSGRLLVNRIATAHELEDYAPRLEKQARQLRYIRNEKGLAASTKLGQLDLPNLVQKARDLGANILTEGDLVNLYGNRFSTRRIIGDSGRQHTPEQVRAFERTGRIFDEKTLFERAKEFVAKRWQQGIFDQFAPFRSGQLALADPKAYTLMRLAKGATGAFEALMHHGKLSLRDGAYDADTTGGVIDKVFAPIGKETTDFLYWVAGNRAERLKREGKENLMDDADIQAFKALDKGTTSFDYTLSNGQVTRDRTKIYADTLKKFNSFNKNVLDMAEKSGMIDPDSRKFWEHEFYVPFYRVLEEQEVSGGNIAKGVVRQKAFEKLKGGDKQLNDLLANTLMNWHHLIDASAKNRAAKAAIEAAARVGIANRVADNMAEWQASGKTLLPPGEKKTVWFMDNGQKREYKIDDPAVMEAITGLEYSGMHNLVMDALTKPKHWLTMGVTASPFFKVRNLIRDSVQAIATSDLSYNPIKNISEGIKLTNRERQEYVSALAGGGLIRFGTMFEGNEAARTRQLIKKASKDGHILDGEGAIQKFYDKYLEPGVAAYNELGNRGEEINRMSLYDQLIKQGVDHATASLMARDLMDFSLQGSFTTIRFLAQVVPFFNARIQGLYKLGRASKENREHMAIVTFAAAAFGLALMGLAASDDDSWKRWKKREEWDKSNYWWFEFAGVQFRIPKPFELGAVATLAERSVEAMFDNERDAGKRYGKAILDVAMNQLSFNPVPQAVKPIIDLYANKDSFTGRPIETMAMQRLAPTERYTSQTSIPARLASEATFGALSPVQYDHIVRSYFGWLGATSVGTADIMARSINNEPTKPALDYWKFATGGMVQEDQIASRYTSMMYEQAAEIEQAHATYNRMRKEGRIEEAKEFAEDNEDKLKSYRQVEGVKKQVSQINERIRMIERSDLHPAEKRIKIRALKEQASEIAARLST